MNKNKFSTFLFYISLLLFIIAFNFADHTTGGWYQQFLPDLNGASISDITFVDSLTGYAVTPRKMNFDTTYIIKTTNGGDNWNVIRYDYQEFQGYNRIVFLNKDTGYVTGVNGLEITTNGGINWTSLHNPDQFLVYDDISVLSTDTIWTTAESFPAGGVFRTTNGGINWSRQFSSNFNPNKIYMFNKDMGFISVSSSLLKTTNSGLSWTGIPGAGNFLDIYFADSLTGWKVNYSKQEVTMQKSTDGGMNWINQILPEGGNINESKINNFYNINKDTIWGVGGYVFYGAGQSRGIIYRTTNGGENWLYQIPDTSIHISVYTEINFYNKVTGWAYVPYLTGIHTTSGGDTTFYTGIVQQVGIIPKDFTLKQNYPNPFNPRTIIPFSLKKSAFVKLTAYDITGKEVQKLVNGRYEAGEYEVDFIGKFSASGVYFYRIEITDYNSNKYFIETKPMMLIK